MQTSAPSLGRVVLMVLFALSCVGLLLFLWLSFGGTIPFKPEGYRVRVSFPNADQLATQADVRGLLVTAMNELQTVRVRIGLEPLDSRCAEMLRDFGFRLDKDMWEMVKTL